MATNYELPSAVEKRTRFFDGQFLQDQDFVDEQSYHLDRQRRHNRLLHVSGIAEGLNVTTPGENRVRVGEGTAIDSDGRQLVLAKSTTVELPAERFNNTSGVDLYVSYQQSPEDRQTTEGSEDFTRWLERPLLKAIAPGATFEGETPPVLLAKLDLDGAGRVTIDESVRTYSGVRLPGAAPDAPSLRTTPSGEVSLTGDLTISRGTLRLDTDQQLVFADGHLGTRLKIQLWDGYGLGIDPSTLFYAADGRHEWRDRDGEHLRMVLTTAENGGLHVVGTGYSSFAGQLRVPNVQVRRKASAPGAGNQLFLELLQEDDGLYPSVPEVHPSIRFYHYGRFAHRIEARADGFHVKDGNLDSDAYSPIVSGPLRAPNIQLRREASESTGGKQLFLELFQDDTRPEATVPEVYPSIRFHHNNRFWHRIEGRGDGFHFKDGNLDNDRYSSIVAGDIFTTGRFYLEPSANYGTDPTWGPADQRRYWFFRRENWHVNNLKEGSVTVYASNIPFPSDMRLKRDVEEIPDALACVGQLRGVHFTWNAEGLAHLSRDIEATTTMGPDATPEENEELWQDLRDVRHSQLAGRNIGLLAQEVEEVAPELVHTDATGIKSVDYGRLSAVLVQAVKEQQSLIGDLKTRIAALEQGA